MERGLQGISPPFLDIEKRRFLQWASFHLFKGFPFMREDIVIIGGGLAGTEAAWQAANRGAKVTLYEMRPKEMTKAHKTGDLAELVCSNSLGSADPLNAPGILKTEMRRLNSLVIRAAEEARVPAGSALAVDREQFARVITQALEGHPNIRIMREEVTEIPQDAVCIIATGPLTSEKLSKAISELTHERHLYFFDAISPIIDAESINMDIVYRASRYGKGGADYLNCPLDEAAYNALYDAMMTAEKVQPKEFEKIAYFESCIPIEVMAERGRQTMQFGPLTPVGLEHPTTGVFFAGQLVGVEGYTESAAMGGIAGINAARGLADQPLVTPPPNSAHGCLIAHITKSDPAHFQPMNTNFGLFPPVTVKTRDKDQKRRLIQQRAVEDFDAWIAQSGLS